MCRNKGADDRSAEPLQTEARLSSIATANARFKSVPAGSSRDSNTLPCMSRTSYLRGSDVVSNGSYIARLRIIARRCGPSPPELKGRGGLVHPWSGFDPSVADPETARRLWEHSIELIRALREDAAICEDAA
jgi:hypothetical protein